MTTKVTSNVQGINTAALQAVITYLRTKILTDEVITAADLDSIRTLYNTIINHYHDTTDDIIYGVTGPATSSLAVKNATAMLTQFFSGTEIAATTPAALIAAINTVRAHTHQINDNPVALSVNYTTSSTPNYVSPCAGPAGGWTSPVLYLNLTFPPAYLYVGRQFTVTTKLFGCTSWTQYPVLTGTFTYGTSGMVQSPGVASKQVYMRIYYTQPNSIQGFEFYAGSSTNYPQGQLYISNVTLL